MNLLARLVLFVGLTALGSAVLALPYLTLLPPASAMAEALVIQ